MKHGSLFSGIGGFDLAAEWMGWENVFHCEWNPFGQRVLKHYWPNATSYGDIKTLTLENIWQDYVQSVRTRIAPQVDPTANHVTQIERPNGEQRTMKEQSLIQENGTGERKKKSLNITEDVVHAVESLKWNFSQLTTKKIMAMRRGDTINLKHGNLLLNADSLMTTKSSATIVTMQKLITEFVHIIGNHDVNIISGGVPCQPASTAGKRKGKEDDRWLWPEAFRVIRMFQPDWVVLENVRGLLSLDGGMVFDEVQAELEAQGYEVTPFLLPACAVNAPHRRDRIWFIAYSSNAGIKDLRQGWEDSVCGLGTSTNAKSSERTKPSDSRSRWDGITGVGNVRPTPNTTGNRRERKRQTVENENGESRSGEFRKLAGGFEGLGESGNVTNTIGSGRVQDNEQQPSGESKYVSSGWERFPTQSPLCSGNDGFSPDMDDRTFFKQLGIDNPRQPAISYAKWRSESIKAGGNAIVPQVAHQIFKAIEQYNELN